MNETTFDLALKAVIALGAVLAAFLSWRNKAAIQSVHVSLNSRLTQLLELTAIAARAEGRDSMVPPPTPAVDVASVQPAALNQIAETVIENLPPAKDEVSK